MTEKQLIISYRENERHDQLVPLIQQIVQRMSEETEVNLISYPKEETQQSIQTAVAKLYPTLDEPVVYLSDYTSSVSYETAYKDYPDRDIQRVSLEELYRAVFWLKASQIAKWDECKGKSTEQLREIATRDIDILVTEMANKLNDLEIIQRVELVTDCLSHHISSMRGFMKSMLQAEWVTYDNNKTRYREIENNVHAEFGEMMLEKLQVACPEKAIELNLMIDKSWSRMTGDRRKYLESIDVEHFCLINDGHNWLGDPNNGTDFNFASALLLWPSEASLWNSMQTTNKRKREERLSDASRLGKAELEERFISELSKILLAS